MAKKLLIVEDDGFLIRAYETKLKDSGLDIKIVTDGDEALAALADFKPDLILLDLVMPRKDGYAFLDELRQMPEFKHTPVIVASNLGQKADMKRARDKDILEYIVKSDLPLDELVHKIKTAINR